MTEMELPPKAPLGIEGLDEILNGGLLRDRIHLVQGSPGTGKTTLALQFLIEGVRRSEKVLYLTLAQTKRELRAMAASHNWDLSNLEILELSPADLHLEDTTEQTLFRSTEVELGETTNALLEAIDEHDPDRVVFDSMAEIRLLAGEALRFRRQIMRLKLFFGKRDCTALLIDGEPDDTGDTELAVLVHGLLHLECRTPDYGDDRRRLHVVKMHGAAYQGGFHDYRISKGGLQVYPRLQVQRRRQPGTRRAVKSGLPELDDLMEGGLELGTACMLTGPDGTGKSSLATVYLHAAAQRGRKSAVYLFDERPGTFFVRSESLGMDLKSYEEDGTLMVRPIVTGEISPGEFIDTVRRDVNEGGAEIVLIDSLNGYVSAMPQERLLMIHMQELLNYLNQEEVLSLIVVSEQGVVGSIQHEDVDVGYMADSVLLLRHFEANGEIHQAVSAVKRRHGQHERTIRQLLITPEEGLRLGPPVREFSGVLTGTPTFEGSSETIITQREKSTGG